MIEYRHLSADDARQWLEIWLRALQLNPEAFVETVEENQALSEEELLERVVPSTDFPQHFIFGAFEDGRLIGINGFRREKQSKISHKGYIWGSFVVPEARGRGVGKEMLQRVIEEAKNIPEMEQLHLWVSTTSPRARAMYTSMGFERIGTEHRSLRIGRRYVDIHQMVLNL